MPEHQQGALRVLIAPSATGLTSARSAPVVLAALIAVSLTSHLYFTSHTARTAALLPSLLLAGQQFGGNPSVDQPRSVRANARSLTRVGLGRGGAPLAQSSQPISLHKFASAHANVHNHFNFEHDLVDRQTFMKRRSAGLAEWRVLAS